MTTSKLNRAALALGAVGVLAAILTATMTPALGASAPASTKNHAAIPALSFVATLHFIVGSNVAVPANSAGSNATKCPTGTYPVGGGPSSPSPAWTVQWSDPDHSTTSAPHPDEWTVGLFNNSSSTQVFKVFVVCSTAQKVTSNY